MVLFLHEVKLTIPAGRLMLVAVVPQSRRRVYDECHRLNIRRSGNRGLLAVLDLPCNERAVAGRKISVLRTVGAWINDGAPVLDYCALRPPGRL